MVEPSRERKDTGDLAPETAAETAVSREVGPRPRLDEAPWLQRQRILLPDPVEGYVERPELERRCRFIGHRLTMLFAPSGFGKTAFLAHRCRRLRARGVCVAWLSLTEEDGPGALATYLLAAFEEAGLGIFDAHQADLVTELGGAADLEMDGEAAHRVGVLIAALERLGAPCVLALDEVERLGGTGAVRTLNVLLARAPRNLRFAMAYRERPVGLDIATPQLDASSVRVTATELRFSEWEIARFFGMHLSRRERSEIMQRSAGWPLALRIFRNAREEGAPLDTGADTLAAWIETRLWRGLAAEDRELILDMALFDWFDGELMDEVLDTSGTATRIAAMRSLTGLLQTTSACEPTMRLHPLIRDYGAERRLREMPDRFRTIHAGIARSLARRGKVIDALHHAVAAGDLELTGRIAERTGSLSVAVHEGTDVILKVVRMLKGEVLSRYPRLELTRCLSRVMAGDLEGAENVYGSTSIATCGFTRDRPDGDDEALALEHMLLLGLVFSSGCRPRGTARVAGVAEVAKLETSDIDPRLRGIFSYGVCVAKDHAAEFGEALEWGRRARAQLGARSHLTPLLRYELGLVAMAEGRVAAAAKHYDEGLALARSLYLRDSGSVAIGGVLKDELAFEQTGGNAVLKSAGVSLQLLGQSAAISSVYLASLGVGVPHALWLGDTDRAAALVDDAREYALRTRRPLLAKYATALQVSVLLADDKVGEATRTWHFDGLPQALEDCLDLERRGWRQTEMLASTKVRLCVACGAIDTGRELAAGLWRLAEARSLKRTVMRALALSMVVEHRAGDAAAAMRHLAAFVQRYAETGYAAGLAAEREVAVELLERLADERALDSARNLATVLRGEVVPETTAAAPALTVAELEVLDLVALGEPDKRIATGLNLSVDGVRYRLRTAFTKLGVRNRFEAVRRAREAGILLRAEARRH